ncbi:hypothetical protein NQZ68_033338 [Dissostichus eleginoides]|nr:hypothetical protein NQZ68_033338 [Dissostichus eleginoides]
MFFELYISYTYLHVSSFLLITPDAKHSPVALHISHDASGQARLSLSRPLDFERRPDVPEESRRFLAVTVNSRLQREKVRITRVCLLSEARRDLQPALQTDTLTTATRVKPPVCPP